MTTIIETGMKTTEYGHYFDTILLAGPTKVSVTVFRSTSLLSNQVTVLVHNSSNQAWGWKIGRTFSTVDEALAAYKRPKIRAAVALAYETALEALPA